MSTVQQIEWAIEQLSPDELANFRAWLAEYDAAVWIGSSKPTCIVGVWIGL